MTIFPRFVEALGDEDGRRKWRRGAVVTHRVAERLSAWQRDGTLHDLFVHRTSMSYAALSAPVIARLLESGPASLSRPLIALDDDARVILLTAFARRAEGASQMGGCGDGTKIIEKSYMLRYHTQV